MINIRMMTFGLLLVSGTLLWVPEVGAQGLNVSLELVDSLYTGAGATNRYYHIDCADDLHCVVGGERSGGFGDTSPDFTFIRSTTDGGATWTMVDSDTMRTAEDYANRTVTTRIAHPTPDLILVATRQGYLHRSTDGGVTWNTTTLVEPRLKLDDINMLDSRYGVLRSGASPYYTDDGGASWKPLPFPDSLQPDSDNLGGIVNATMTSPSSIHLSVRLGGRFGYGAHARTEDLGGTWRVERSSNEGVGRFSFISDLEGWACGLVDQPDPEPTHDLVMHTTDGGLTWTEQLNRPVEPADGLANIDFYDRNLGIAGGALGKILLTGDGGQTWQNFSLPPETITGIWGVSFPARSVAYLCGGDAKVYKVTIGTASIAGGEGANPEESGILITDRNLRFSRPMSEAGSIVVYNLLGQKMFSERFEAQSTPIYRLVHLARGTYIVRLRLGESVVDKVVQIE